MNKFLRFQMVANTIIICVILGINAEAKDIQGKKERISPKQIKSMQWAPFLCGETQALTGSSHVIKKYHMQSLPFAVTPIIRKQYSSELKLVGEKDISAAEVSEGLEIFLIEDEGFLVEFKEEPPFDDFENTLMARWWINGKPLKMYTVEIKLLRYLLSSLFSETNKIFVPLGVPVQAKLGDEVQLQLLYSSEGFYLKDSTPAYLRNTKMGNRPILLISNRITITVTEDVLKKDNYQ